MATIDGRVIKMKAEYVPQYPAEHIVMTKVAILKQIFAEDGIRSKWNGKCLILRGQFYRHLPSSPALAWLLRVMRVEFCYRKTKLGGRARIAIKLKSPKLWFPNTQPSGPGRVWVDAFELVANPVIFYDETKPASIRARRYMQLWWDSSK